MAGVHGLKNRIKSLESTKQMTKSMKTVSATRLRKNQVAYMRLRPYAEKSREMLEAVAACAGAENHDLLRKRENIVRQCYVLFVGNRGLCGVYNQNVLRYLCDNLHEDGKEKFMVACGRWGKENLRKAGLRIDRVFDEFSDTPSFAEARELTAYLVDLYLSGQADEIILVHQRYNSVIQQSPEMYSILPVNAGGGKAGREYIFEPDRDKVLAMLARHYVENMVYAALLEARTGEQAARMTAMTTASDNADELIRKFKLELNHMRQAAITTEIAEIAGGSAVLDEQN